MTTFLEKIFLEKRRIINRVTAYVEYVRIFTDWYKVVFPINKFFTGRQLLMHLRGGMVIFIRDSRSKDLSAIREVIGNNDYHLENIALPQNPVIFDIGANIGTFSMVAKKTYPTASIFAFEPHPENFALLVQNAPFAISRQIAITDKNGTVEFEATGSPIGLKVRSGGGLIVRCATLEAVMASLSRVDLLKIDVEGSEYAILRSTSSGVFSKIEAMLLEIHMTPEFDLANARKFAEGVLEKQGFFVVWIKPAVLFAKRHQTQ